MKNFKISFIHTDGNIRQTAIEAFNKERAVLRFKINWGLDMKILNANIL